MDIAHFNSMLRQANEELAIDPSDTPRAFGGLPLSLFGHLLWQKELAVAYPHIQAKIPAMPHPDIQEKFTGAHGYVLLVRAIAFVRAFELLCSCAAQPLKHATILDYGFGWGRITRFLPRYTSAKNIYALDPLKDSVIFAANNGLQANVDWVPYVPTELPLPNNMDVVILFSVFTHLPLWLMEQILSVIRRSTKTGGVVIFTVRPLAFWKTREIWAEGFSLERAEEEHRRGGFAYVPQGIVDPATGRSVYGEASISEERLQSILKGWEICGCDCLIEDPTHIIYAIKAV